MKLQTITVAFCFVLCFTLCYSFTMAECENCKGQQNGVISNLKSVTMNNTEDSNGTDGDRREIENIYEEIPDYLE